MSRHRQVQCGNCDRTRTTTSTQPFCRRCRRFMTETGRAPIGATAARELRRKQEEERIAKRAEEKAGHHERNRKARQHNNQTRRRARAG